MGGIEHGGIDHGGMAHGGIDHGGMAHGGIDHGGILGLETFGTQQRVLCRADGTQAHCRRAQGHTDLFGCANPAAPTISAKARRSQGGRGIVPILGEFEPPIFPRTTT